MLSKNQQARHNQKREKNNARRKQRQANLHAEAVWRKSAKGRAIQAKRQREELAVIAAATLPRVIAAVDDGQKD